MIAILAMIAVLPIVHNIDWYGTHPAERHQALRACGLVRDGHDVSREVFRAKTGVFSTDSPEAQDCLNAQYAQDYFVVGRVVNARTHRVEPPPSGYKP